MLLVFYQNGSSYEQGHCSFRNHINIIGINLCRLTVRLKSKLILKRFANDNKKAWETKNQCVHLKKARVAQLAVLAPHLGLPTEWSHGFYTTIYTVISTKSKLFRLLKKQIMFTFLLKEPIRQEVVQILLEILAECNEYF